MLTEDYNFQDIQGSTQELKKLFKVLESTSVFLIKENKIDELDTLLSQIFSGFECELDILSVAIRNLSEKP